MRSLSRVWLMLLGVSTLGVVLTNCANPLGSGGGGSTVPTPTPSASPTFSPGPCGTINPNATNLVVIGMAGGFGATSVAPYGPIAGYAVIDPALASPPPGTAQIINTTVSGAPITSQNTIQFTNYEPEGTSVHSAFGFSGKRFPSKPYDFPSPAPSPTATAITNGNWFTGFIPSLTSECYSQTFTVEPGTYYFGDYNLYDITAFQDVLVVGTPAPKRPFARHPQDMASRLRLDTRPRRR